MTTMISHLFLQHYWWIIVSLLAAILVFLMFVQGGQSLIYTLPKSDMQKNMIINAMGRKWEFTFTTLVTFGGAFFASFPLFYSTSFGGAYWVWIAILFSFIIQAVAYEFRSKPNNIFGKKTFDLFLFLNGALGPFLIGVAVATFFTGARYSLNFENSVKWETGWYGLEAILDIRNLALGFAVLFLARLNGLLYIINAVDEKKLIERSGRQVMYNSVLFLIFFLFFVIMILISSGFAVDPVSGEVSREKFKYMHNFVQMPVVSLIFLLGVGGVLIGIAITLFTKSFKGIYYSGTGTVMAVFALFLVAGFNGTSFYPSTYNLQSSLTIQNASSSEFTLKTMMYVSFLIPFILTYIWYAWKAISGKKLTEDELNSDGHMY